MNEYDDKRRKLALKSKLEQLERETWLLDTLLRALQIGRPHQIDALLTLIRSNPPKQDIRAYLEHGFGSPDDAINVEEAPSADPVNGFMPSLRIHRHRSMRVTDVMNPPISVPARPWTTVTDDDDFVSHLISLWFTWAHPWWQWMDKASFLEAMRSGDPSSPLCTPYLVNMILTDACVSDAIELVLDVTDRVSYLTTCMRESESLVSSFGNSSMPKQHDSSRQNKAKCRWQ